MNRDVRTQSRVWPGLVLIALGTLFLLDNLDFIEFRHTIRTWWPSILIAIGLWQLLSGHHRRWGGPFVFITLGVLFQIDRLRLFEWWRFRDLWPILLIVIGAWLLFDRLRGPAFSASSGAKEEGGEIVDAFVIWGGLESVATSKHFRGGEATAIMGGIELDLRQAELAPGTCRLKLTAIMGGIELRVPANWEVVVEGTPLLGAIEDARRPVAAAPSPEHSATGAGRLLVHGFAMMGGIEVKS